MTLVSSAALKVSDVEGMVRSAKEGGSLRHNSFSSVVATMVAANSMLFYLQSNALGLGLHGDDVGRP
jgi:hypothetical protein